MKITNQEHRQQIKKARLELRKSVSSCLICGRKNIKFCHSHSVPKFILSNIAKKGKVASGTNLINTDENMFNKLFFKRRIRQNNKLLGIKSAGVFKLICNKCDSEVFSEYESPNFVLNSEVNNKQLNLIALKDHLYFYYKIYTESNANLELFKTHYLDKPFNTFQYTYFTNMIGNINLKLKELKGYKKNIKQYVKAIKNPYPMNVILDYTIDKNTRFAFSLFFLLGNDLLGNQIYDLKDYSKISALEGRVYLCIFPYENTTRIIMFYRKRYFIKLKNFDKQMKMCSSKEREEHLTRLIVGHHEEFYMHPDYFDVFKKNKRLKVLFLETYQPITTNSKFHDFSYKKSNMFSF
ncbi:MAG: hypothetical protein ACOCUI_00685 [bacterium]